MSALGEQWCGLEDFAGLKSDFKRDWRSTVTFALKVRLADDEEGEEELYVTPRGYVDIVDFAVSFELVIW